MKDLLRKMQILEREMKKAEQQSEYWMQSEHFDMEKADKFEAEADSIYADLYQLFGQAAEKIVSITSGGIDEITARAMIRERRSDVESIFAREHEVLQYTEAGNARWLSEVTEGFGYWEF